MEEGIRRGCSRIAHNDNGGGEEEGMKLDGIQCQWRRGRGRMKLDGIQFQWNRECI
jgi:hypothetical protein